MFCLPELPGAVSKILDGPRDDDDGGGGDVCGGVLADW